MKLSIKNIGKLGEACIEINGITVIAGENNTGKSTVGKTLYCLFNAFHNINEKITEERNMSIYRAISNPIRRRFRTNLSGLRKISTDICENRDTYIEDPVLLRSLLEQIFASHVKGSNEIEEINVDAIFNKVLSYLKLDENSIKAFVLQKILASEYGAQIGHVNHKDVLSSISLEIHGEKSIEIAINGIDNINVINSVDMYSNIAYIEDPFAIDELNSDMRMIGFQPENHRSCLLEMLVQKRSRSIVSNVMDEMVVSEKLSVIFNMLNNICEGNLERPSDKYMYSSSKYEEPLALSNISTGLKTFLILKTLLMNGAIEEGGTIILDEPEIHLHPEWQLAFAELIVLIQKEFGIHILLNTHSPYFLRALQVYSAKYHIADSCKYYLSDNSGDTASIIDVTNNIERIYAKLSRPLQRLEDMRWQDD